MKERRYYCHKSCANQSEEKHSDMKLCRCILEQFIIISIALSCWGISRGKFSAYGRSPLHPRNSIDSAVTEALVRGLRSSSNGQGNNGAAYSNGYPSAFLGNQRSLPAGDILDM